MLEPEGVLVIEVFLLYMLDGKLEHTAADLAVEIAARNNIGTYVSIYNEEKRILVD